MCADIEIKLLTPIEVAELLRVKLHTVQAWATTGALAGAVRVGGRWRFRRDELLELVRRSRATAAVLVRKITMSPRPPGDSEAWFRDFFNQTTFDRPPRAGPSRLKYQTAIPEFLKTCAEPGYLQSAERWLPLIGKFAIREATPQWPDSYVGLQRRRISDNSIASDLRFLSRFLAVHGFGENHRVIRQIALNERWLVEGFGQVKYEYPKSSADHRDKFVVT